MTVDTSTIFMGILTAGGATIAYFLKRIADDFRTVAEEVKLHSVAIAEIKVHNNHLAEEVRSLRERLHDLGVMVQEHGFRRRDTVP